MGLEAFAEFAEAVGVPTDQVLAVLPYSGGAIVLWTVDPDPDDDTEVWRGTFTRDADGILRRGTAEPCGVLGQIIGMLP